MVNKICLNEALPSTTRMIVDVLELRTDQLSKLAITPTIGRTEEMLNGPVKSSCGAKRNMRHDPAVCVETVEQSVDLTWTCRYEVKSHPYAAERRLQSANKTMAKQQILGPKRNLTVKNAKYHQVVVLITELDKCGAPFKSTNVSLAIGSKLSPVLRNVMASPWLLIY